MILVKAHTVGGGEDDLVVLPLGGQMTDTTVDGFDLKHHAGSETEGIVINFAVLVQGPIAQVMHVYLAKTFGLRALDNRVVQR